MLTPWESLVVSWLGGRDTDREWLVALCAGAHEAMDAGRRPAFRHAPSWRLGLGQALIVGPQRDPSIVVLVAGSMLVYGALIGYLVYGWLT